jgi:hypothetical protein
LDWFCIYSIFSSPLIFMCSYFFPPPPPTVPLRNFISAACSLLFSLCTCTCLWRRLIVYWLIFHSEAPKPYRSA